MPYYAARMYILIFNYMQIMWHQQDLSGLKTINRLLQKALYSSFYMATTITKSQLLKLTFNSSSLDTYVLLLTVSQKRIFTELPFPYIHN